MSSSLAQECVLERLKAAALKQQQIFSVSFQDTAKFCQLENMWYPIRRKKWEIADPANISNRLICATETICKVVVVATELDVEKNRWWKQWLAKKQEKAWTRDPLKAKLRFFVFHRSWSKYIYICLFSEVFTSFLLLVALSFTIIFTGFPRQPGQEVQVQLKYPHPASKLDGDKVLSSALSNAYPPLSWNSFSELITTGKACSQLKVKFLGSKPVMSLDPLKPVLRPRI